MKLHVISDIHRDLMDYTFPDSGANVVVIAGDTQNCALKQADDIKHWLSDHAFATWQRRPQVVMVLGNHELYGGRLEDHEAIRSKLSGDDVHVLENQSIVLDGVRFIGCTLWTDYQLWGIEKRSKALLNALVEMADFANISTELYAQRLSPAERVGQSDQLQPEIIAALHHGSIAYLRKELARPFNGPTVVVTHHAPHPDSLATPLDAACAPAYASDLRRHGFFTMKGAPDYWVHGHTHKSVRYTINGTLVVSYPRGYEGHHVPGNQEFDPLLVLVIEV